MVTEEEQKGAKTVVEGLVDEIEINSSRRASLFVAELDTYSLAG